MDVFDLRNGLVSDYESYIKSFRKACRANGISIVAEEWIAQTAQDVEPAVRRMLDAHATAIVHWGFGLGVHNNVSDLAGSAEILRSDRDGNLTMRSQRHWRGSAT